MINPVNVRLSLQLTEKLRHAPPEGLRQFACKSAALALEWSSLEDALAQAAVACGEGYLAGRATAKDLKAAHESLRPTVERLRAEVRRGEAEVCAGRGSLEELLQRMIRFGGFTAALACTFPKDNDAAVAAVAAAHSVLLKRAQLQTQLWLVDVGRGCLEPAAGGTKLSDDQIQGLRRRVPAWIVEPILGADPRSLRRFCSGCARLLLELCLAPDSRLTQAIVVAESYSHGVATAEALAAAHAGAAQAAEELALRRYDSPKAEVDYIHSSLSPAALHSEAAEVARYCTEADIHGIVYHVVSIINVTYKWHLISRAKEPLEAAVRLLDVGPGARPPSLKKPPRRPRSN